MGSAQMRKKYKYHYLYKVERLDTKEYYIGIRSCDVDPIDDNYWGFWYTNYSYNKKTW